MVVGEGVGEGGGAQITFTAQVQQKLNLSPLPSSLSSLSGIAFFVFFFSQGFLAKPINMHYFY